MDRIERSAEQVERACEVMHDAYEAAAVGAGWETQQASRKPWADVPEANKATMRAAVTALLAHVEVAIQRREACARYFAFWHYFITLPMGPFSDAVQREAMRLRALIPPAVATGDAEQGVCLCHGPGRPHQPHQPCDKGCQPDWHRDDCAVYVLLPQGTSPVVRCDTCNDTRRTSWMSEADPNGYQERDDEGMVPCIDCALPPAKSAGDADA